MKYILTIGIILLLIGCAGKQAATGNVVAELPNEENNDVKITSNEEIKKDEEKLDNKALAKKLTEEAGLTSEDEETETEEDEEDDTITLTSKGTEIVIFNFEGEPENLKIEAGDTVSWYNNQTNFKHVIAIREDLGDNFYGEHVLEGATIVPQDFTEFTFTKKGTYQWYSKTRYPDTSGKITVE